MNEDPATPEEVRIATEASLEIWDALELCEAAIQARSMAVRAMRDGFEPEAAAHIHDAAASLLDSRPDLAARYSIATVGDLVSMQVGGLLSGDPRMHKGGLHN